MNISVLGPGRHSVRLPYRPSPGSRLPPSTPHRDRPYEECHVEQWVGLHGRVEVQVSFRRFTTHLGPRHLESLKPGWNERPVERTDRVRDVREWEANRRDYEKLNRSILMHGWETWGVSPWCRPFGHHVDLRLPVKKFRHTPPPPHSLLILPVTTSSTSVSIRLLLVVTVTKTSFYGLTLRHH